MFYRTVLNQCFKSPNAIVLDSVSLQVTVFTSAMCTWSTLSTTLCCVLSLSCFKKLWREGQSWLVVAGCAQDCLRVPVFRETLNVQEAPAQRRMKVWSSPSFSSPSLLLFRLLPYPLLTAVCHVEQCSLIPSFPCPILQAIKAGGMGGWEQGYSHIILFSVFPMVFSFSCYSPLSSPFPCLERY